MTRKVVVVGLDGLDPGIVRTMMNAGALPNLRRLEERGGFSALGTTCPPQTPVAWSTFATGTNPGGHGIFDFISRDPDTYLPDLALTRFEQKNVFLPPKAVNRRGGTPFWELLTRAGVPSVVLRCPCTFPPDRVRGRMLSGMGVPDVRGGLGTPTFYTGSRDERPGESEHVVPLSGNGSGGGVFETHIIGPRHPKTNADVTVRMTIAVHPARRQIAIRTEGQADALTVALDTWSDWLPVKFKMGFLQAVAGMVRFRLIRIEPQIELYASPVNFDPAATLLYPVSSPPDYAQELASGIGTFYTTGMVEEHVGLTNGRIDESAFLEQCGVVMDERERMMQFELERMDEGFFFCLFDTPDRLQHMFWRFREPDHPANSGDHQRDLSRVVEDHYAACDELVGRALERAGEDALFIVLSDHGFGSFQRGLNLNTWLYHHGFLALRPDAALGPGAGEMLAGVDWSRTRAYALGLGGIYLNRRGREAQGIVAEDEAVEVGDAIVTGLTGLQDPQRGCTAVRSVVRRHEVYHGRFAAESPDLIVRLGVGYRASWGTALGGVGEDIFEDNRRKWSGDHIVDPDLVPGVLFMNRSFARKPGARMVDLAPTILGTFGIDPLSAMEGRSLFT